MTYNTIDIEELHKLLRYDAELGTLYWREKSAEQFGSESLCRGWNTQYANKEALACIGPGGYKAGSIYGKRFSAHRVVWAMHYGCWPNLDLDHINGVRSDNRISNLREVSKSVNQKNLAKRKDNTSGYTGVTWHKKNNKWVAHIKLNGVRKHLGSFINVEEAIIARSAAEKEYGFSDRHGK